MASFFEAEKSIPENGRRQNFVFMAYPFTPALPAADYRAAVKALQTELPIRFWYFLDETTTAELMRKIWRAILRADLAIFDISDGNPNVAFELGLAVANGCPSITLLKTGAKNPLGQADLGYSERIEYDSIKVLKEQLKRIVLAKSSGLRTLKTLSYQLGIDKDEAYRKLSELVMWVFQNKHITRPQARAIMGSDGAAGTALVSLRAQGVLQVLGQKRGARWVFTEQWVDHEHEVSGEAF